MFSRLFIAAASTTASVFASTQNPLGAAAVMNASPCNKTDTNQLWNTNATHGSIENQFVVFVDGAERCAEVTECDNLDFAFVSTDAVCDSSPSDKCPKGQQFDLLDSTTLKPAKHGSKLIVRSRLNESLCFGVGAELGAVTWKVEVDASTGLSSLSMNGAFEPLCLASGFENDAYPISLQEC